MKMKQIAATIAAVLLAASAMTANARTWHVRGPTPDFDQIDPAIDASQPGDVILVHPGSYTWFALDRGVTVRAVSTPFEVSGDVYVGNIRAGHSANLTGMTMWDGLLWVGNSEGEIRLESIAVSRVSEESQTVAMDVVDCDNLVITDSRFSMPQGIGEAVPGNVTVRIRGSSLRMNETQVYGFSPYSGRTLQGGTGMEVRSSTLHLSGCRIFGGAGSDGEFWSEYGTSGGTALRVYHGNQVYVTGTQASLIKGGAGGDGYNDDSWAYIDGAPAPGGDGLVTNSCVFVSRVRIEGGEGGTDVWGDDPPAPDGDATVGCVEREDIAPVLDVTPDLHPGDLLSLDVESNAIPGAVVLLLGQRGGLLLDHNLTGVPYYEVLAGGWYFVLPLGRTNTQGAFNLSAPIPNDAAFEAMPLNMQVMILGDSGQTALTNGIVRVLGVAP